ncbi:uncharacterized protein BCN122_III0632 [Burkholderia cenocepacia]|nr:uncharacterized protein BCN122_III0632 [Burkholderia cenocepacia]
MQLEYLHRDLLFIGPGKPAGEQRSRKSRAAPRAPHASAMPRSDALSSNAL